MGPMPLYRYHMLSTQKPGKFPSVNLSVFLDQESNVQMDSRKLVPTKEDILFQNHTETNPMVIRIPLVSPTYLLLKELSPGMVVHTCNSRLTGEGQEELHNLQTS